MYIDVLLELKNKNIDQTFTYKVPDNLKKEIMIGKRVKVPFNKRILEGFILNIKDTYEGNFNILEIEQVVDEEVILTQELLDMAYFIKESTLSSLSSAIAIMLPKGLKASNKTNINKKYQVFLKLNYPYLDCLAKCQNEMQKKIIIYINEEVVAFKKEANLISSSAVKTLIKKDIISEEKSEEYRLKNKEIKKEEKKVLTKDQQQVYEQIIASLDKHQKFLLHGVTGSGKTEVYMQVIEKVLEKNASALVLVPEISLTPQFVNNFASRFGSLIAVLHSGLSDGEKYDEWRKIKRNEAKVVIGTRSSIFAPLVNLGIIIIDEEHSDSYKQEAMPRYNAIDVAEYRSEKLNIPLVLGSATPSLEKRARASKNLYTYLTLPKRVNQRPLPTSTIVDMTKEIKKGNFILSEKLKLEIESAVSRQEQVILFLNRRGYSTTISCSSCGFTYKCPHCEITLTYHKLKNTLRCHYCGYTIFKPDKCPNCHDELNYYGMGTEKLEAVLQKEYPDLKILRMDADTTKNKNGYEKIFEKFKNHEYDILVGTQMVSKGLDFANVSVVGIINADATLNIPDFRSGERTFDLLDQTSGRAGRKDTLGNVIIQTFNPDNYILKCVANHDYDKFYNYEMNIRRKLKYPPFYYLVSLKILAKDYEEAKEEATKVANYLHKKLDKTSIILGPTTSNMFKINNIYRFQVIIKYRFDNYLKDTLKELDKIYLLNKKVRLEIDLNPLNI